MKSKTLSKKLVFFFLLLALTACRKNKDVPKCMDQAIEEYKKSDPCQGAAVDEYSFQGKKVYTFAPGDCGADMTTEVKDENCATMGYLGGIAGNQKINGEDFSNAKHLRNIWKK